MFTIRSKFCQIALFSAVFLLCSALSLTTFATPPLVPSAQFEMNASDEGEQLPSPNDFVAVEVMPEMIYEATPAYPEKDHKAGHEGVVWVKALINKKGIPVQALLAKTSGHKNLDKSALEAATKNRFKPATKSGKPIAVWVTYKVEFVLADEKKSEDNTNKKKSASGITPNTAPVFVSGPDPIYPKEAKVAGIEGKVSVRAFVGISGHVRDVIIDDLDNDPYGFKASAREATFQYHFKPAIKNGKVMEYAWVEFEVSFKLK